MPTYEKEYAMESSEAYEEVKKDVEGEVEEDLCFEKSSISYQLYNSRSPRDKEKQISVDPVSLKQLAKVGDHLSQSPPAVPPLRKPKFVSCSLPGSALSSPRSGSAMTKSFEKWNIPVQQPHTALFSLGRQQSTDVSHFNQKQRIPLCRSKSCGEGRSSSPSDDLGILCRKPSMKLPQNGVHILYDCTSESGKYEDSKELDPGVEENFKCWALCLFLPAFSRKKQVEAGRDEQEDRRSTVSGAVSLEKFECGSWSSSAILDDGDEDCEFYFDLPLELIRSSTDDANSPVKTAFVFDRDRKGVLKKSTSNLARRKSHEASSNRHVRFSTSTPTLYPSSPNSPCITPRLRKAGEEFNAFLEEQST